MRRNGRVDKYRYFIVPTMIFSGLSIWKIKKMNRTQFWSDVREFAIGIFKNTRY